MDGNCTLNEAHAATEVIEKAIHAIVSPADITVHVEPVDVGKVLSMIRKHGKDPNFKDQV
jgi:divalent metal cation (Fe/Co/Zn/Cd) transporter